MSRWWSRSAGRSGSDPLGNYLFLVTNPPLIGITTYGINELNRFNLPREYVDSVRRSGAQALLIPPGETNFGRLLEVFDGIVLAGGGDIEPSRYQQPSSETLYGLDAERDETELGLVEALLGAQFPTLAICRGIQVVNVALGGTLHQHLPDIYGESVAHRLPPRDPVLHMVEVAPDSQLAKTMGQSIVDTQSWHHQAIKDLGVGIRPIAVAPDGVIEAAEVEGNDKLLMVQWHPELSSEADPTQQALFDWLARVSKEEKANGS